MDHLQLIHLHSEFDKLQKIYGDKNLNAIYGAGKIMNPKYMFVFMNPTGRNISCTQEWTGLRAPWLGTKLVWKMFSQLKIIDDDIYTKIINAKKENWDENFCANIYTNISKNNAYITNLAKCTQIDARPLKDNVFKDYVELLFKEIELIKPQKIITFGNQVSQIIINKKISVSSYTNNEYEEIKIKQNTYPIYPTYYPVGQGLRNLPLAVERIRGI